MDLPAELPRLTAWLRTGHPAATDAQLGAALGDVERVRLHRLDGVLDDLSRTCRPPAAADLAALAELDDLLDDLLGRTAG